MSELMVKQCSHCGNLYAKSCEEKCHSYRIILMEDDGSFEMSDDRDHWGRRFYKKPGGDQK